MPHISIYEGKQLLLKIADGDADAFKRFFELYRERLFVFVEQIIHSRADTEEIIQEVFLKIWQTAPNLLHVDNIGHYIYVMARNKTLNHMRKISRERNLIQHAGGDQSDVDNHFVEALRLKETHGIIEESLTFLSEQKRLVFKMSRENGLSHAEIAAETGLSQSRVKNIIVEVLKHLKNDLSHHVKVCVVFLLFLFD